jgi:hypothetical protein
MGKVKGSSSNDLNAKLFAGERMLVVIGLLGFALAAVIALYIGFNGAAVGAEGNLDKAVSFDAAFGLFILSLAAIIPVAGLNPRRRKKIRWTIVLATVYAYAVETIQHFRGINPRFTRIGSITDTNFGVLFGVDSLVIIVATVLIAAPFFSKRGAHEYPLMKLGIRYAFVLTMVAFAGGICMSVLQGRHMGAAGNLIVLHGLGFHALQALPLHGWLLDLATADGRQSRRQMHIGGTAWTIAILLITVQTAFGRTMFETSALPLLAGIILLVWLVAVIAMSRSVLGSAAGLPSWRAIRFLANWAVFPIYLAVLCNIGIMIAIGDGGLGFVRDFSSAGRSK